MPRILIHFTFAIKSAYRNFRKNRLYGSLNILGLSIAFATIILIIAYLYQETSYEDFHQHADRIYRPTYHLATQNDFEVHFARIPVNYINQLPKEIPEIEHLIRFQNQEQKYIRIRDKKFKPKRAYITDPEVFKVFNLPFITGDPNTALIKPNSIVLTESVAKKYFSNVNVVGEEVILTGDWSTDEKVYKVTGVIQDLPVNTHLPIEILLSFTNQEERTGWAYIYTLLAEGTTINEVEAKLPEFMQKYTDPDNSSEVSFDFQSLRDIHLHSHLAREIKPNGQIIYIKIFFWVGLFVWIIALINFANLSAALTIGRGKEIGVRKFLGATKGNLILFSLTEAVVYSLVALILGVLLGILFFSPFSHLTGISIFPPLRYFIPLLLGISIFTGLLAGILPSLIMASVKILQTIKQGNNWSMKRSNHQFNMKRVMITIQFCATIILIGSALIGHQQFRFINTKNLGLTTEQVLVIPSIPDKVTRQYIVFKNRLKEISGIKAISACMQIPSTEIRDAGPVLVKGINEDAATAPMMDVQIVDPVFIEMMDLELLAGENHTSKVNLNQVPEFNEELSPGDYLANAPRKYLINETAMRQLGWDNPSQALSQEINWSIGPYQLAFGPITGIIKDYHQESLKNEVDPLVMIVEPLWLQNILIQIETDKLEKSIAGIEKTWNDLFPYALEYEFLDELFHKLYTQDRVQLKLLSVLALIAILISFMGLVSLVAYALKTRSKELAIRRVIGANLRSLVTLIGKEYFWILALAAIFGIPLSYLWVSEWLQNFAYHINISPLVYLLSILLVYSLLIFTIYLQTLKATVDNPVNGLREE